MEKELTRAEEQVMQILWDLEEAYIRDILACFPEPRPAYTTVSTIIRILEKKGFVDHKAFGNTHQYFPLKSRKEYAQTLVKGLMANYFNSSFRQMVSFFSREKDLSVNELEELKRIIDEQIRLKM